MSRVEDNIVSYTEPMILGPLEWQVLEIVWEMKECSVREVVRRLPEGRAYTTVMTTLARLHQKGILSCNKVNRKYLYSPRLSCQELKDSVIRHHIVRLLEITTTSQELLISFLLEELCRRDSTLLEKIVMRTMKHLREEMANLGSRGIDLTVADFCSSSGQA